MSAQRDRMTGKRQCDDDAGNKSRSKLQRPHEERKAETAPRLISLADDAVKAVLSFLDFRECSKFRRVCRRMKNFVDDMPPPGTSVKIFIFNDLASSYAFEWDATKLAVKIKVENRREILRLPPLRTIRPTKLSVERNWHDDTDGFSVGVVRHLAQDVGRTVTDLSLIGLFAATLIELQQTISKFDEIGSGLRKLHLLPLFPLSHAVSIISCLRNLESVSITLKSAALPRWQDDISAVGLPISTLEVLPNLQELCIYRVEEDLDDTTDYIYRNQTAVMSFAMGCSNLHQLKNLCSEMLVDCGAEFQKSFPIMLSRLVNLEELSMLQSPTPELWREVRSMGGHKTLKTLAIAYANAVPNPVEYVKAMVEACIQSFPSLVELEIRPGALVGTISIEALAGLQQHGSLRRVYCGLIDHVFESEERAIETLDQALGEQVTVSSFIND